MNKVIQNQASFDPELSTIKLREQCYGFHFTTFWQDYSMIDCYISDIGFSVPVNIGDEQTVCLAMDASKDLHSTTCAYVAGVSALQVCYKGHTVLA